jgi:2-iminobutanoate/2-iminopropanoate deaminase
MIRTFFCATALGLCALGAMAANSERTYVLPEGADPKALPPYSSGIMAGGTFYVAGTLGIDPATGQVATDPEKEAHMVIERVQDTLKKAGLTLDDLVSVTIYCTDLSLYEQFNGVYRSYFHGNFPTRAFIGAGKLVRNAHFEIQAIAVKSPGPAIKKI